MTNERKSRRLMPERNISALGIAMIMLVLVLCSVYIGCGRFESFAVAALIVCGCFLIFLPKSLASIFLLGAPAAFIFFYTGSAGIAALFVCAIIAVGCGAFLTYILRTPALLLLLPISYGLSYLIGGSWKGSFMALACFPAAAALAFCIIKSRPRTESVCLTAAVLAVTFISAFLIWFTLSRGAPTLTALRGWVDALKQSLAETIAELAASNKAAENALALSPESYAASVFNIAPATVICVFSCSAYTAGVLTFGLMRGCGYDKNVTPALTDFNMSRASGAVFIIAFATMLVTSYIGNFTVELVAENILIVMLPGLALTGLLVMLGKHGRRRGRIRLFLILTVLAMCFVAAYAAVITVAVIGAIATLFAKKFTPPADKSDL